MNKNIDWDEWETIYQSFKESKLSIKNWCTNNNMDVHQFYYRRKKYNERTNPNSDTTKTNSSFVKIEHGITKTSTMTISYNSGISLAIDGNVDIALIESISKVLNNV